MTGVSGPDPDRPFRFRHQVRDGSFVGRCSAGASRVRPRDSSGQRAPPGGDPASARWNSVPACGSRSAESDTLRPSPRVLVNYQTARDHLQRCRKTTRHCRSDGDTEAEGRPSWPRSPTQQLTPRNAPSARDRRDFACRKKCGNYLTCLRNSDPTAPVPATGTVTYAGANLRVQ